MHLISCLMPTNNRLEFVRRALYCFQQQTWKHRELIVLDQGDDATEAYVRSLGDNTIHYHRTEPGQSVEELRVRCAALATGDLLANWDDDDWHHPSRLRLQAEFLIASGAYECWLGGSGFTYLKDRLVWSARDSNLRCTALVRREDLPCVMAGKIVYLNANDLYVKTLHAGCTEDKRDAASAHAESPAITHLAERAILANLLSGITQQSKDLVPEFRLQ
jgi:glycosyltransferase involved in cell wall biosynthesis